MSLVIKTAPSDTGSVNNEMLFVVEESTKANDPVTYPDYSYVCDVYVNSTLVERLIARPDPTYKMGIFDVSRALQPYASYGLNPSNGHNYTARVAYRVKLGEQYGGTLYTNVLQDSSDRYAFKSYIERPYSSNGSSMASGILSARPARTKLHRDQVYNLLPVFYNVSGSSDFTFGQYNAAGTLLSTTTLSMSGYTANTIRQFNLLNSPLNANTKQIIIASPEEAQAHIIDILCESKYDAYTIAWLNKYGAYETQSFGLVSKKTIEVSKKDYQRLPYQINVSGEVSYDANNVYYGGRRGYGSVTKTKLQLTSHLLTDDEYSWLSEMFRSPDVYLYLGSKFIPVTIQDNSYEYRTYLNSRLTPLQFTVEFADPYNSQWL